MYYERHIAISLEVDPDMTYTIMGFTGNYLKLHAPLLIAHPQQFYSPFCLHILLKIKYDQTTGNFFQAAL